MAVSGSAWLILLIEALGFPRAPGTAPGLRSLLASFLLFL